MRVGTLEEIDEFPSFTSSMNESPTLPIKKKRKESSGSSNQDSVSELSEENNEAEAISELLEKFMLESRLPFHSSLSSPFWKFIKQTKH